MSTVRPRLLPLSSFVHVCALRSAMCVAVQVWHIWRQHLLAHQVPIGEGREAERTSRQKAPPRRGVRRGSATSPAHDAEPCICYVLGAGVGRIREPAHRESMHSQHLASWRLERRRHLLLATVVPPATTPGGPFGLWRPAVGPLPSRAKQTGL